MARRSYEKYFLIILLKNDLLDEAVNGVFKGFNFTLMAEKSEIKKCDFILSVFDR